MFNLFCITKLYFKTKEANKLNFSIFESSYSGCYDVKIARFVITKV